MKPYTILKRYLHAYEENNQQIINSYLHPKYIYYAPGRNRSVKLRDRIFNESFFFQAFKVIKVNVGNKVEEKDQIACHIMMKCRHIGKYFDIEKTGRIIKISYLAIIKIKDDKIITERAEFDINSILEQLRK
jgi:predicted ester cyclase